MAQNKQILRRARFILHLVCFLVPAGYACAAVNTNAWLDRWFTAQSGVHTWSAEVIQTRTLLALNQPLVATGKVWVALPDRFRWELGQPAQTIALRQRETLWVIYPRLKRAEKYPLSTQQPGPWRDALALLDSVFPRNRQELEQRFHVASLMETNGTLHITMEPRSATARKVMPEILVAFRTNDFSLLSNEVKFMDGSSLRNEYRNPVKNAEIPPGCFDADLPKDFKVVDPLKH